MACTYYVNEKSDIISIRVRPYYKQNHKYLGELIVHNDSDDAASAVLRLFWHVSWLLNQKYAKFFISI